MKISIKYKVLCIKGLLILSLPIILNTYPISLAYAADSTPSADIKSKLEEFRKEAASKAAQLKELISKKLQNKAYIGKVKSKSDNSLTLAAVTGPKIISLTQDTVFANEIKPKQKFTIDEEDRVAALGDIDETGVLIAKKVILLPAKKEPSKSYLWGQIFSVSEKMATLKDKGNKNISVSLPKSAKVKTGDFVILTGSKDENEVFDTVFVYVAKKAATPSAKIATPSAKPK